MSNAIANVTPIRGGVELELNNNQLALIRRTLAADCTDDEFSLFIEIARRLKADPFRRHLYALVFSKDDAKKRRLSIVTGIDFYRTVAARNRDYRPDDQAPVYVCDEALKSPENPLGIDHCLVRAHKLVDGQWFPAVGIAYWSEYVPLEETCEAGWRWIDTDEKWEDTGKAKRKRVPNGETKLVPKGKWLTMPRVMIAKCAEAQALRKGWPEELGSTYVEEELDRAKVDDITAAEAVERDAADKRLKIAGAKDAIMVCWAPGEPLEAVPIGQFADRALDHISKAKSVADLTGWKDTNRAPLREFWARHKSDALEVSKAIEARLKELKQNDEVLV